MAAMAVTVTFLPVIQAAAAAVPDITAAAAAVKTARVITAALAAAADPVTLHQPWPRQVPKPGAIGMPVIMMTLITLVTLVKVARAVVIEVAVVTVRMVGS